ncbi:MAG: hypothetical protein ABEJ92_11860 [Halobacteriales archaeon]
MTDPRVLVRLDMLLGLLGLVVVLLAVQLVVRSPDVGLPVALALAALSALASYWYRREREAAAE